MKPGTRIAFILDAQLKFGILVALITRETKEGTTEQFVVSSIGPDGTANRDETIEDEENIADMEKWNTSDRLLALASRLPSYKWALEQSEKDAAGNAPDPNYAALVNPEPNINAAADNF